MSEVKWPRYFRNSATPALTARQDAPGLTSNIYLWGELQNVTQSASSVGNFFRYGVWIETDAEGNEIVREEKLTEMHPIATRLAALEAFHAAIVAAWSNEYSTSRFALAVSRALAKVEQKSEVRCE